MRTQGSNYTTLHYTFQGRSALLDTRKECTRRLAKAVAVGKAGGGAKGAGRPPLAKSFVSVGEAWLLRDVLLPAPSYEPFQGHPDKVW